MPAEGIATPGRAVAEPYGESRDSVHLLKSSSHAMDRHRPLIHIVIPVHNRLAATRECLESLVRQTYRNFRVVLVDDGSSDGTGEYVSRHHPNTVVLRGDGNLWWAGAVNLGVRSVLRSASISDYVLTLNNDTVLPPSYLDNLMRLAEQAPTALIGSIAFDYKHKEVRVSAGVIIDWFSAKVVRIGIDTPEVPDSFYAVSVLSGRGTLIPVRVFRQIGLYDEQNFPHYAADYDLSLRAQRSGYALLLHPSCYLYSRTDLTGISNVRNAISFGEWFQSFTSMRSPNNLKIRFRFGIRHPPLLCRPSFVVCDALRVMIGTTRNQFRNLVRRAG